MSNCRQIEVVLLYPTEAVPSDLRPLNDQNPLLSKDEKHNQDESQDSASKLDEKIEFGFSMSAAADLSPTWLSRDDTPFPSSPPTKTEALFRLLDLPLELRLKIYALLLPSRSHTIVTQIPHNGYFYNTSTIPRHSATSFYPFGTSAPVKKKTQNLTTYKVLNRNFRKDFPGASIYPHLFLVCRQIKEEAEPVLYGGLETEWDFGTNLEAVPAFFGDRSEVARQCVRHIKVAREIRDAVGQEGLKDLGWEKFCTYISSSLPNLKIVDLTIWSSSGSILLFPSEKEGDKEVEKKWREWEFTHGLLNMEGLRRAKVTWWGFQGEKVDGQEQSGQGFDSWLARRMVQDEVVRERMVTEGVVREGSVILASGGR